VVETLEHYARLAYFIPGEEIIETIELANPAPLHLAQLKDIAAQGIINATRKHRGVEHNPHSQYPTMLAAVQSGYAEVLGYAGLRLEALQ